MTLIKDLSPKAQQVHVFAVAQNFENLISDMESYTKRLERIALDDVAGGDDADEYVSDIKELMSILLEIQFDVCGKYYDEFKEYSDAIYADGKEKYYAKNF